MKKIEKNGMTVSWYFQGEYLHLKMTAPTSGWLAIGLNTDEGLAGTNLIMAAVADGEVLLSDRYILSPGDHRSIAELGGNPSLLLESGSENEQQTSVSFKIAMSPNDQFHFDLETGKRFYLLMAYSLEDDFMHHSVMRTSVEISL